MQLTYRTASKWLTVIALVSISWSTVSAATIYVPDLSFASVQTAINSASDGDNINIPAGSATWTSTLTINKAITLQGAGSSSTIITNAVPSTGTLMTINLVAGKPTRLTGFQVPNTPLANTGQAAFIVSGHSDQDGSTFRVDHCVFGQQPSYCFWIDACFGVADHNTFTAGAQHIPFEIQNNHWGGQAYGDGSWADDSYYGTNKFFFMEDNTFTCSNSTYGEAFVDSAGGARYVVRNNIFMNASVINHGTESTGRQRGGRVMEVYNNVFQGNCAAWINIRSGTAVIWGNNLKNVTSYSPSGFKLECKRLTYSFAPWGEANGTNVWDSNVAGGPWASGTATGGGSLTLTDSTKSWTTNQWAGNGYVLVKTGGCTGYCSSQIMSNTATSITVKAGSYSGTEISFTNGNTYQIWKVNECLDQPGVGKGGLVTGGTPVVPSGWYNQVTDPIYQWSNTSSDSSTTIAYGAVSSSTVKSGVHYFSGTAKSGYTPYTYPHPLVTGSPTPPTNLRVEM